MTKAPPKHSKQDDPPPSSTVRTANIITTLIKLGGLAIATNEAFIVSPPRDAVVLGLAAFMMAGAQGLENLINNFVPGGGSGK